MNEVSQQNIVTSQTGKKDGLLFSTQILGILLACEVFVLAIFISGAMSIGTALGGGTNRDSVFPIFVLVEFFIGVAMSIMTVLWSKNLSKFAKKNYYGLIFCSVFVIIINLLMFYPELIQSFTYGIVSLSEWLILPLTVFILLIIQRKNFVN